MSTHEGIHSQLNNTALQESLDRADGADDVGFVLTVSEDKLEAFICPKGDDLCECSVDDIKELLAGEGITYGIVDDTRISEYLAAESIEKEPWQIAQGNAAEAGKEPEIVYHFDTAPLKVGTADEFGNMDYKNRGVIPQVKQGDVIAEKIPGVEGTAGMDVYGQTIPCAKLTGVTLLRGKGTKRSEDGNKVLAKIDGRPEVSDDGRVLVSPDLMIPGDVGLATGHIDFNGNIEVRGSVQEGFRIRGKSLRAEEILKAETDISGDIVVSGGIIGSCIKGGGILRAKHIHKARIEAAGDIEVDKEIYESTIETKGACKVERGKIVSSSISAMKGISAREIGSETSSPCTLTVGIDPFAEHEINAIKDRIGKEKELQKTLHRRVDELQQESDRLDEEVEDLPQQEDRARLQQMALEKKMEGFSEGSDPSQIAKVKEAFKYLVKKIDEIPETLEKLLDEQNQITKRITDCHNEIEDSENEIQKLRDEIKNVNELSKDDEGIPVVKVSETVFSHTRMITPHASLNAEQNHHRVIMREAQITESDSTIPWTIEVSPLQ
jgi:uncharacterized protein (DUF342 family)